VYKINPKLFLKIATNTLNKDTNTDAYIAFNGFLPPPKNDLQDSIKDKDVCNKVVSNDGCVFSLDFICRQLQKKEEQYRCRVCV